MKPVDPAMAKLFDVLVKLCRSIPGVTSTTVSTHTCHRYSITLSTDDDQAATDLAAALGFEVTPKSFEGRRWIGADGEIGGVHVGLHGPHVDCPEPQAISTKRIDAACAVAEEALR